VKGKSLLDVSQGTVSGLAFQGLVVQLLVIEDWEILEECLELDVVFGNGGEVEGRLLELLH
jgi:hypothetical protein